MKTIVIKATPDGKYNIPVSKDKQKHYKWMASKPLGAIIRKELKSYPAPLIGYK